MSEPANDPPFDSVDEFGNVWRWSAGRATFVHGPGCTDEVAALIREWETDDDDVADWP